MWEMWFSLINSNLLICRLPAPCCKLLYSLAPSPAPSPRKQFSRGHLKCCLLGLKSSWFPWNKTNSQLSILVSVEKKKFIYIYIYTHTLITGTSLVIQWLRLHASNAGGSGSIPGQWTRSRLVQLRVHLLQLKILPATTKIKDPHRLQPRPGSAKQTNPLQYSCLENPVDRGACQATVHVYITHIHTYGYVT